MKCIERNIPLIVRTKKNEHYTTISNFALEDNKLSLKAKGLWAFIMTKPNSWNITSRGLASQLKEGRDAVMSAMKELETAGYLERGEHRNTDGTFTTTEAILHEKSTTDNPTTDSPALLVKTNKVNTEGVIVAIATTVPEEKEVKQTYGNPDINEIISTFEKEMDMKLTGLVKERRYAKSLLAKGDLATIKQGILAAAACQTDQYAPQITSIETLFYKWNNLLLYYRKKSKPVETNIDLGDLG